MCYIFLPVEFGLGLRFCVPTGGCSNPGLLMDGLCWPIGPWSVWFIYGELCIGRDPGDRPPGGYGDIGDWNGQKQYL